MARAEYNEVALWWPTYFDFLSSPPFGSIDCRLVPRDKIFTNDGPFTSSWGYVTTDFATASAGILSWTGSGWTWDLGFAHVLLLAAFPTEPLTVYLVEQVFFIPGPTYYRLHVAPTNSIAGPVP